MKNLLILIFTFFAVGSVLRAQNIQQDLAGKIDITVAKDGSGNYKTIQEAINAAPNNSSNRTLIFVKKGIYNEKVKVPASKINLTLLGEDVQETILTYLETTGIGYAVLYVEANDFWLVNMTIENKQGYLYDGPQAVALQNKNCDRNIMYHCKLFSYQDTWFANTKYRTYAKDCFIEGSVDYIFGPSVSVVDSCVLFCNRSSGAVITAANTNGDDLTAPLNKYGYVFFNCKVFSMPSWTKVHNLGRPWRQKASVIFYKCDEGNYISSSAWTQMSGNAPENALFYEFRCTGPSAIIRKNYILPPEMALALSKTDTSSVSAVPCFDSIFNPNVIPAKRGSFSSIWNPEEALKADHDSIIAVLYRYTTKYMDTIAYSSTKLARLQYDTINIELQPGKTTYVIDVDKIDNNKCFYPVFEYPGCGYMVTRPAIIPGMGRINVAAKDKSGSATYNIYFNKDGAYTNSNIKRIKLDSLTLPNFSPDVFEYHFELNDYLMERYSKGYAIRVLAYTEISGTTVEYSNKSLTSFPDSCLITVTAPDGITKNMYKLICTLPTTSVANISNYPKAICLNPFDSSISCTLNLKEESNVVFQLFDENGALVLVENVGNQPAGEQQFSIKAGDISRGIYIYKIDSKTQQFTGKILKQ